MDGPMVRILLLDKMHVHYQWSSSMCLLTLHFTDPILENTLLLDLLLFSGAYMCKQPQLDFYPTLKSCHKSLSERENTNVTLSD